MIQLKLNRFIEQWSSPLVDGKSLVSGPYMWSSLKPASDLSLSLSVPFASFSPSEPPSSLLRCRPLQDISGERNCVCGSMFRTVTEKVQSLSSLRDGSCIV